MAGGLEAGAFWDYRSEEYIWSSEGHGKIGVEKTT